MTYDSKYQWLGKITASKKVLNELVIAFANSATYYMKGQENIHFPKKKMTEATQSGNSSQKLDITINKQEEKYHVKKSISNSISRNNGNYTSNSNSGKSTQESFISCCRNCKSNIQEKQCCICKAQNGVIFEFYAEDVKDWHKGDLCAMIIDNNGTKALR